MDFPPKLRRQIPKSRLPPTPPLILDPQTVKRERELQTKIYRSRYRERIANENLQKMSGVVRNKVQRKFKMRGYSLKVDALSEVLSFLSHFPSDALDDALELLLDELHHLSCPYIKINPLLFSFFLFCLFYLLLFNFCSEISDSGQRAGA